LLAYTVDTLGPILAATTRIARLSQSDNRVSRAHPFSASRAKAARLFVVAGVSDSRIQDTDVIDARAVVVAANAISTGTPRRHERLAGAAEAECQHTGVFVVADEAL
jgi:hypothetical protein